VLVQESSRSAAIIMLAEAGQDIDAGWRQRAITIGSLMIAFSLSFVALSHVLGAR
jgi:hypothetical protein